MTVKNTMNMEAIDVLTGAQKAAIIMIYLSSDNSSNLIKNMTNQEVIDITTAISKLGHINTKTLSYVLEEFYMLLESDNSICGDVYVFVINCSKT